MAKEPNVSVTVKWKGEKLEAHIVIDDTITINMDVSPVSSIDETIKQYTNIALKIVEEFQFPK
jgi:hypothetical protein